METWRAKAKDCFPELEDIVNEAWSPMSLWIELDMCLCDAYDVDPPNDDLIRRIYGFADWCFKQPHTESADTDLSTAVSVCLIEHIPLDQRVAGDLHRWFSLEDVQGFEPLFRYHISDVEYTKFRSEFIQKKNTTK